MTVGYLDTSCMVALAFDEPGSKALTRRLERYDVLVSSNLLEAELLSALKREGVDGGGELMAGMGWVFPDRRLTPEIERILAVGYLRGADLWHVATALYLAEAPQDVDFLTLDTAQREVAAGLGFSVPVLAAG